MIAAICDDEPIFIDQLVALVDNTAEIEKYDTYDDLNHLWDELIGGAKYDVVFMDIDWKEKDTGIHFASKVFEEFPEIQVIFVTAYNDRFSQDIFLEPVNLCGYLVKPVEKEKLQILLGKAKDRMEQTKRRQLTVQYRGATEVIPHREILYLESKAHQVIVHTNRDDLIIYDKLDELGKRLSDAFLSVHKSFIVNMEKVQKIDGKTVLLTNGTVVPISKSKMATAKDSYLKYMRSQM